MNEGYKGFYFYPIEEWSQFFQQCNWYTFHPLMLEFENDECMGGMEITVIVMGCGFRLRWNHSETEQVKHIKELASKIIDDD